MKRHYSLLFVVLLSQTTPIWAMEEDDLPEIQQQRRSPGPTQSQQFEVVGDIIEVANGNRQARFRDGVIRDLLSVQHIRYEAQLQAGLQLNPHGSLPAFLGYARQRVKCVFEHRGRRHSCELLRPLQYPLQEERIYREDRDHHRDILTLRLRTIGEKEQLRDVHQNVPLQTFIPHAFVRNTGPERVGRRFFDGDTTYLARIVSQEWRNRQGVLYASESGIQEQVLPSHSGGQIIYVEPFAIGNDPIPQRDYRGGYDFIRDLATNELLQGKEPGRLIYSDGNHVYFPHVTQELWQRKRGRVGFFIASYKADRRLHFLKNHVLNSRLEQGLYQLSSVQEEANRRLEKWIRLGESPHQVEITGPAGVASLPGMGALAPREILLPNAVPQIVQLQTNMERSAARMQEITRYIEAHPHAEGLDVIIGPAGSGKSIFAHLLARRQLHFRADEQGIFRLGADRPLPGFFIGHGGRAGTTFPAVWYDDTHNRFIVDLPGFGDPNGPEKDILNAFSIHSLLKDRNNVKVIMTIKEDNIINRANSFIKSLNDITGVFQNDNDLRENFSFVVTHQRQIANGAVGVSAQLTRRLNEDLPFNNRSKNLLRFLANNHHRIFTVPEAREEGIFGFDVTPIQIGIQNSQYAPNPLIRMEVGNPAKHRALELTQNLNNYLTNYMRTKGAQRIINFCRNQINVHNGSVDQLRASLTKIVRNLRTLQQIPANEPERFVNGLRKFMNVHDIEKIISQISFLRNLRENVVYQLANWTNALLPTIEKIESLTTPPTVEEKSGELYVKASFLGTSDIQKAITRHPDLPVRAYAWNTIFFDSNITNHAKSFIAIAPQWKVSESITIDLSGLKGIDGANGTDGAVGKPGEDGQPGDPGQNGGNFYGKVLFTSQEGLRRLTVNASGGQGGKGGNGGKGVDGIDGDLNFDKIKTNYSYDRRGRNTRQDRGKNPYVGVIGRDGKEKEPENNESRLNQDRHRSGSYRSRHDIIKYNFRDEGSFGVSGGKGGKGGEGAYAGFATLDTSSLVAVNSWSFIANSKISGSNGQPGEQGLPGRDCVGHTIVDIAYYRGGKAKLDIDNFYCSDTSKDYKPKNTPQTAQGASQVTAELNNIGQQSVAEQTSLNLDLIRQDFARNFDDAAANRIVAPFVKTFPGLRESISEQIRFQKENLVMKDETEECHKSKSVKTETAKSKSEDEIIQEQKRFLGGISKRYIDALRKDLWGGDIELIEIGKLYNLNITVHEPREINHPLGPKNGKKVHLWFEDHHYQIYDPVNKKKTDVPGDGHCLFSSILRSINSKITVAELRNQVANQLQSLIDNINKGAEERREGNIIIKLTHENDNPIYIRFAAAFNAESKKQFNDALELLPLRFRNELRSIGALSIKQP